VLGHDRLVVMNSLGRVPRIGRATSGRPCRAATMELMENPVAGRLHRANSTARAKRGRIVKTAPVMPTSVRRGKKANIAMMVIHAVMKSAPGAMKDTRVMKTIPGVTTSTLGAMPNGPDAMIARAIRKTALVITKTGHIVKAGPTMARNGPAAPSRHDPRETARCVIKAAIKAMNVIAATTTIFPTTARSGSAVGMKYWRH